ncbi:MAG TPA: hypothetical protein VMW36_00975 [Patescibacteria group bacterium]|nr:hypothetical protein [Patescibacteria group bacterium]
MFAVVTIVIELVWRQDIEKQIGRILDSEIREKRSLLVGELHALISYLEKEKYPTFSDSETEELSNNLQALKSIKSKFTIAPKIIWSTLFIALASMLLFLYLINPTLLVLTNEQGQRLTLAHFGVALLMIGVWFLFDILTVVLEAKPWEKE